MKCEKESSHLRCCGMKTPSRFVREFETDKMISEVKTPLSFSSRGGAAYAEILLLLVMTILLLLLVI